MRLCAGLQVIGHPHELLPVHRLDSGTEGVVVLAKNADFARRMHSIVTASSLQGRARAPRAFAGSAASSAESRRHDHARDTTAASPAPTHDSSNAAQVPDSSNGVECTGVSSTPLVVKEYRALAPAAAPVGRLHHWAEISAQQKGQPAHTRIVAQRTAHSVACQLDVLEVR